MNKKLWTLIVLCALATVAVMAAILVPELVSENSKTAASWAYLLLLTLTALGFMRSLHRKTFASKVPSHEGPCVPVWVNSNQVDRRILGTYTGFFRAAKRIPLIGMYFPTGPEFHGYFKADCSIASTEGQYGRLPL